MSRYLVLGALAILTGIAGYIWRGAWLVDAYAINLSATFIGTLLLLLFIERGIERAQEKERLRRQAIALSRMRTPIIHLVELISDMIKASSATPITVPPSSIRELFNSYGDELDWIDLDGAPGSIESRTWFKEVADVLQRVGTRLSETVDTYGHVLDTDIVHSIEMIRQSHFASVLNNLGHAKDQIERIQKTVRKYGLFKLSEERRVFLSRVADLVEHYERRSGEQMPVPNSFCRPDVMPRAATSRLPALRDEWAIAAMPQPPIVDGENRSI